MTGATVDRGVYLSTGEASRLLGVALRTIQVWVNEGRLPTSRTPGGHRRLHVAHVQMLVFRMAQDMPMPTDADYDAAARAWQDAPTLPRTQAQRLRDVRGTATNADWLLQMDAEDRERRDMPTLPRDSHGHLSRLADVPLHDAWCRGVQFALSTLKEQA
jgi:excisionase family DNA binding protein